MRLTKRIERIEAVDGPPPQREMWYPRNPRRRVSETEANEAFGRLLKVSQAENIAFADDKELPPRDDAALKRDTETLHHWSWQRGQPHETDMSRVCQQSLEILTDDQLEKLCALVEEQQHQEEAHS